MGSSPIEWIRRYNDDGTFELGHTINPLRARNLKTQRDGHFCEKISPACDHCYASSFNTGPYGTGVEFLKKNRDRVELYLDRTKLLQVLKRKKPTDYFWMDMTAIGLEYLNSSRSAGAISSWYLVCSLGVGIYLLRLLLFKWLATFAANSRSRAVVAHRGPDSHGTIIGAYDHDV